MARKRILPPKQELKRMIDAGMTHAEIAQHVCDTTGIKVGRSAVSVAVHRYGLAGNGKRYTEYTPWRVSMDHIRAYPLRMLRHMGRSNAGGDLNPAEEYQLGMWLKRLDRERKVVAYSRSNGAIYVDAGLKDHDGEAPIVMRTWD